MSDSKHNPQHLLLVAERIMEYNKVLAADEFVPVWPCKCCCPDGIDPDSPAFKHGSVAKRSCVNCLLSGAIGQYGCKNTSNLIGRYGHTLRFGCEMETKAQQRNQLNHLLSRIAESGYEIVEVDDE